MDLERVSSGLADDEVGRTDKDEGGYQEDILSTVL
jgi:hypothetical protein